VIAGVERGDGELRDGELREGVGRRASEVDVVRVGERREGEVVLVLVDLDDAVGLGDRRC
jgi:hypothetical protein